jgi:hypothetical protein
MRILMTNHSLQYVGGTEKWTYAMALELVQRGHEVDVFTFMTGMTSDKLGQFARIRTEIDPSVDYDLILANHCSCQSLVQPLNAFKIFTSHGPSHPLEHPTEGADAYVGVSAEVRASLASKGYQASIITNGIDLRDFSPVGRADADTPRVLSMCKHAGATKMVGEACKENGWEFAAIHYLEHATWDVAELMQWADIVVGCGRTAIEALACECEVFVFDARSEGSPQMDGWITAENVEHLRQCNFSTRAHGSPVNHESIAAQMAEVEAAVPWQRPWAMENADIVDKADAYLRLHNGIALPVHDCDETAEYERIVA